MGKEVYPVQLELREADEKKTTVYYFGINAPIWPDNSRGMGLAQNEFIADKIPELIRGLSGN